MASAEATWSSNDDEDDCMDWSSSRPNREFEIYISDEALQYVSLDFLNGHTIKEQDQGNFQLCLVCLKKIRSGGRPCCNQPVCYTCLKKYVRLKLKVGVLRMGCPNPDCDSVIQVEELKRLGSGLVQEYHRRLVDANSDPHRKTCPNCGIITELEPQELTSEDSKYGVLVNCTECQFRWCFRCHGPQHQSLTCDENRASDDLLRKWAQNRRTTGSKELTAQQCPVCEVNSNGIRNFVRLS